MAKPNYQFEKRQRELAKKRKKEEKAMRKTSPGDPAGESGAEPAPAPADALSPPPAGDKA